MIDQYACIEYLSKYVAKGESKSPMLAETFDMVLKTTDNNSDAKKAMKKNRNENTWSTRFQCTKRYALTFIPEII